MEISRKNGEDFYTPPATRNRTLHFWLRTGAVVGTTVFLLRRLLYLLYPDALPSHAWHPATTTARWLGSVANGLIFMVAYVALMGVPLCLFLVFTTGQHRAGMRKVLTDLAFAAVLYAAAYFLIAPAAPR